jgi:hypothetical protein
MAIPRPIPQAPVPARPRPLEPGDHLTRDEFEQRYDAMPGLKKAELLEGVVYMPSPVRWNQHASPHADFMGWLSYYRAFTPGVQAGDNGSIRLALESMPQPDATMIVLPSHGGLVRISDDDYVEGSPELAGEIAASSVSLDLHTRLRLYRENNVREYIVWRVQDQEIDWFALRQGQYDRLPLNAAGHYQSEVFPGLWLDPAALTRSDLATVLQVLQQGITSPEHAAFVARLQQAAANKP